MANFRDIKATTSIVEVARRYTAMAQKGKQYKGICPICQADAFYVDPEKAGGVFKCFSCKAGGDVIQLVAKVEKTSLKDAGDIIASMRVVTVGKRVKQYLARLFR